MKKSIMKSIPVYSLVLMSLLISCVVAGKVVEVISVNSPIDDRICFIIDAGHGGVDGGAVSCTGVYESHINLEISLRLSDLLELMGHKTLLIREDDRSVYTEGNTIAAQKASDLKNRVRIVNETDNGILLSIHQNHYQDSYYWGGQMFYAKSKGSQTLAECLQKGFNDTINIGSNRQSKQAEGIYLMKHIERPGVLVECGFLSNYQEAQKLLTKQYQLAICCVIGSVCSNYVYQSQLT